ncbi:MAG: hypothetical protein ACJAUD_001494 [Crocinitomicaceae bacterium]|jgi:hypothetical protein
MKLAIITILALTLISCWDPDAQSDSNWAAATEYDIDEYWQSLKVSVESNDSLIDLKETYQYESILDFYETFKGYLATEEDKDNPYFKEVVDYAKAHLDSIQELQNGINNRYVLRK